MCWIIAAFLFFFVQIAAVVFVEYRRPNKAVTWIVILLAFPLIGFLIYYFVAKEYSCTRAAAEQESGELNQIRERLVEHCSRRFKEQLLDQAVVLDAKLHAMLKNKSLLPITACNQTTVYAEGEPAFEAMLESIAAAKHHIHIEFFIIREDRLGSRLQRLLMRKAKEGVRVRFLYDGIGSRRLRRSYVRQLQDAGVETGCFFPPLSTIIDKRVNYRNHRKILVVDGNVGFFGGLNIGNEYLGKDPAIGHWRDTHFRMKGDAVLWIQYTFLSDWKLVRGQVLSDPSYFPDQDHPGNEFVQIVKSGPDEAILDLIFTCIASAKERIYIETPYFIPDAGILQALKTAAMCGIDVRVIIPAVPDHKLVYHATLSFAKELMQSGVRFYRYQKGFIHAKLLIADHLAFSGTANMDVRSLCGQFEIDAFFFDGKVVGRLVQYFKRDLGECEEILLPEFKQRPGIQKLREVFARLLSSLF